jgi:hypothetical protein
MTPDKSIIHNALKSLPKDLDETYSRLFLNISQEEWCAVRHILHWMWFHNELYTVAISSSMMSQVIQLVLSTENNPMSDMDFNPDLIREFCGCLIRFELDHSVTFAHYTVLEYLKSTRILKSAVAYFALFPTTTIPNYTKVVILAAQSRLANFDEPLSGKYSKFGSTSDNRWPNFEDLTIYFSVTAMACIQHLAKELESHDSLFPLIMDFWDPVGPHFEELSQIPRDAFNESLSLGRFQRDSDETLFIMPCKWVSGSAQSKAAAMLQLILGSQKLSLIIIEKVLAEQETKRLFTTKMTFSMEVSPVFSDSYIPRRRKFDGSLLEIVAQLSYDLQPDSHVDTGHEVLPALVDCQKGPLDWSQVLISYVGFHRFYHEEVRCGIECIMYRLLENGADADSRLFGVTPLQIAVAACDIAGVRLLLEANADPNSAGSPGLLWSKDHPLEGLNYLSGHSPLDICRDLFSLKRGYERYFHHNEDDEKGPMIEELLIEYGAEEAVGDLSDGIWSEDGL